MFKVVMATQVKDLLSLYNLLNKLITYVKDESGNLSTLAQAFTSVFSCGLLGLMIPWQGSCFGHAFNDIKVVISFKEVSLKPT
jgi:hypothetical protein